MRQESQQHKKLVEIHINNEANRIANIGLIQWTTSTTYHWLQSISLQDIWTITGSIFSFVYAVGMSVLSLIGAYAWWPSIPLACSAGLFTFAVLVDAYVNSTIDGLKQLFMLGNSQAFLRVIIERALDDRYAAPATAYRQSKLAYLAVERQSDAKDSMKIAAYQRYQSALTQIVVNFKAWENNNSVNRGNTDTLSNDQLTRIASAFWWYRLKSIVALALSVVALLALSLATAQAIFEACALLGATSLTVAWSIPIVVLSIFMAVAMALATYSATAELLGTTNSYTWFERVQAEFGYDRTSAQTNNGFFLHLFSHAKHIVKLFLYLFATLIAFVGSIITFGGWQHATRTGLSLVVKLKRQTSNGIATFLTIAQSTSNAIVALHNGIISLRGISEPITHFFTHSRNIIAQYYRGTVVAIQHYSEINGTLQLLNPFRLLIHFSTSTCRLISGLLHFISEAFIDNKLAGNEWLLPYFGKHTSNVLIGFSGSLDALGEAGVIFHHAHHGQSSCCNTDSNIPIDNQKAYQTYIHKEGHSHGVLDYLESFILIPLLLPLHVLSACWDVVISNTVRSNGEQRNFSQAFAMSYLKTHHRDRLMATYKPRSPRGRTLRRHNQTRERKFTLPISTNRGRSQSANEDGDNYKREASNSMPMTPQYNGSRSCSKPENQANSSLVSSTESSGTNSPKKGGSGTEHSTQLPALTPTIKR